MIQLTEKWFLDSDSMQFIVYKKVKSKKGKTKGEYCFYPIAYCGNLVQVKNYLINKEIMDDITLLNNIDKCIQLSNEIDRGLKEIENEDPC